MDTKVLLLAVLLLLGDSFIRVAEGYGEPNTDGHPVYQERANHVFMNAARIDPSGYKTVYMAGYSPSPANILVNYSAVAPTYWTFGLGSSSYSHSSEMATKNYFSHSSYDGTDPFTRIKTFYTCSGTMGENIAAGLSDPLATSNQWICDQSGSACAADNSGNDGHRSNIMGGGYVGIGVGFAYSSSSTYGNYWTQDFGGSACSPTPTSPIYSASHLIVGGKSTQYIAIFYSTTLVPSSAVVVIAGTSSSLSVVTGKAGKGTYSVTLSTGTACRSYYFLFVAGGTNYRYPDTGCLVTYGDGSGACTTSFDASCSGNAATATTATATTGTATTATATTATATTGIKTTTSTSVATTGGATSSRSTGSSTSTTGSNGAYTLYGTSAFANGWYSVHNGNSVINTGVTYLGQTCLSAQLTGNSDGGNNWFGMSSGSSVTNVWTSVKFSAVAAANTNIVVFFNGGYTVTQAITASWATYTISMSSLGITSGSAVGGNKFLVFNNPSANSLTVYMQNVVFV